MKPLAPLACALLLSACAADGGWNVDTVTRVDIKPAYQPNAASVFAGSGGWTTITGTTQDGASAEEIAAAMRLPARLWPRTVRAAPEGEAQGGPALLLVFAPQGAVIGDKACRGEYASGGTAGPERLNVYGVFCTSYGNSGTEAMLTTAGSPVPSDPDFAARLGQLLNALFPVINIDLADGACRTRNC